MKPLLHFSKIPILLVSFVLTIALIVVRILSVKIELIVPAVEENARVPNLALPILAALTPPDVEISCTDDLLTPIDLERDLKEVDLVGITISTKTALRAYQIADAYRRKGTSVVLGGIHPSVLPEEAKAHADAVVIGEAEESWGRLIEDFRAEDLKPFYRQEGPIDPLRIPKPRWDILPKKGYFPIGVVQATRGCPFQCEFCSVHKFFGERYRCRPISHIVEEVKTLPQRWMMFNDDNIIGHPPYSNELFKALIPLKKRWFGQASLSGLKKIEHIEMLAKSGCIVLYIGFESTSKSNLIQSRKYQNDPSEYREIIRDLHRYGIAVCGSFVFGLDEDDPCTLEEAVSFAIQTKLFTAVFCLLTPYPDTVFYQRVKKEGRLVRERWWLLEKQEEAAPHFIPKKMSGEVLRDCWKKAWREFNSFPSIGKRFQWDYPPTLLNRLVYFPFQFMQRRFTQKKILQGRRRVRVGSF